jgi:transposase-like protein
MQFVSTILNIKLIFILSYGDEAKRQLDLFIDKYQTSMPKLTQWAEDNIPEGLSSRPLKTHSNQTKTTPQHSIPWLMKR